MLTKQVEPRDRLGPPEWNLTTRGPLLDGCAALHQAIRQAAPKLVRCEPGIIAGWPQWNSDGLWLTELMPEGQHYAAVRVSVWPNGAAQVFLFSSPGTSEALPVVTGTPTDNTPLSGARAAFDAVIEQQLPQITQHLLRVVGLA